MTSTDDGQEPIQTLEVKNSDVTHYAFTMSAPDGKLLMSFKADGTLWIDAERGDAAATQLMNFYNSTNISRQRALAYIIRDLAHSITHDVRYQQSQRVASALDKLTEFGL